MKGGVIDLLQSPFKEELEEWEVGVWLHSNTQYKLACKENVRCSDHRYYGSRHTHVCTNCEVPICDICAASLNVDPPCQPRLALTNDMWTGFSSEYIYARKVTYLELFASPCCLCLICFILQDARTETDERRKRF